MRPRRFTLLGIALAVSTLASCGDDQGVQVRDGAVGPEVSLIIPDAPISPDGSGTASEASGSACGNGQIDPGEQCDDRNTWSGDGCSSRCQIEDAPPCPLGPCSVNRCGDAVVRAAERCDDGNVLPGDGCSSDCQTIEPGWVCRVPGRRCTPICGDRVRVGGETCDDGNTLAGDGCSAQCLTESGWDCSAGPCIPAGALDGGFDGGLVGLRCGDGVVSGAEECDDGPANDDLAYGACTTACVVGSFCGDGMVNGEETCDLGAQNGATPYGEIGCTRACTRTHFCGDNIVDAEFGEECDLGELNGVPVDSRGQRAVPPNVGILMCKVDCRMGQTGPVF